MAEKETKTDFSSFMCVILMLTGCLVTIMISNVVVISANPENVQITSIIPTGVGAGDDESDKEIIDPFGNVVKAPWYLEVWRDRLIIHPGGEEILIRELESKDNKFERFLKFVEERKNRQYIVLLVRQNAGSVARKLKYVIRDRKIDIGMDLLYGTDPIRLRNVDTNQTMSVTGVI
ncbi:MAG: hypothetical protein NZ740_07545 [Kiritimatiellae bacterium]|nr:hypothetical protein [Kiritimatiellia bacterium]MDW8458949.1 hypothetical protein [Verrucomicrobiota bacterium]